MIVNEVTRGIGQSAQETGVPIDAVVARLADPAPETIGRLRAHGAKVLRTDLDVATATEVAAGDLHLWTSIATFVAAGA